jgi:hypothetical protein
MCNATSAGLIRSVVSDKVAAGIMFTAFDISPGRAARDDQCGKTQGRQLKRSKYHV